MSSYDSSGMNNLLVLSQAKQIDANNNEESVISHRSNSSHSIRETKRINSIFREEEDEKTTHVQYKSGVVYDGTVKDSLKNGHGTFVWPNGDKYVGQFKLNCRNGHGKPGVRKHIDILNRVLKYYFIF